MQHHQMTLETPQRAKEVVSQRFELVLETPFPLEMSGWETTPTDDPRDPVSREKSG